MATTTNQPTLNRSTDYDPSLLHYWTEVRPRGEWTTVEVSPACTPRVVRRVHVTDMVDHPVATHDSTTINRCGVCAEVAAILNAGGAS